MTHPAQYSAAVLERFEVLLGGIPAVNQPLVFDPFAGPGTRLGRLCDKLDMRFAGIDIEDWPGHDSRVRQAWINGRTIQVLVASRTGSEPIANEKPMARVLPRCS